MITSRFAFRSCFLLLFVLMATGLGFADGASAKAEAPNVPTLVARSTAISRGASGQLTLRVPPGVKAGYVLIAQIVVDGGATTTITAPAGWSPIRRDDSGIALTQATFFHLAATEPATYTWTIAPANAAAGGLAAFSNTNHSLPVDSSSGQANPSAKSITAPPVTIPNGHSDTVLSLFAIADGAHIAVPKGTTPAWSAGNARDQLSFAMSILTTIPSGATSAEIATAGKAAVNLGSQIALSVPITISTGPGTEKNSANAPGVFIAGKTVTAYVPFGSDDNSSVGAAKVVIEKAAGAFPAPTVIITDRVNSCTPAQSGELVCSGQTGTIDLIAKNTFAVTILPSGATNGNEYTGGDCTACGAEVDDALGLGIISTGEGFVTINLTSHAVSSPISSKNEPVGLNFGYDPVRHRILSANYKVINSQTFASSNPHFQIFDLSGASQVAYDLANDQGFFQPNGNTCHGSGGTIQRDILPETSAIDTTINIAYVTFHTPADCFSNPIEDIALFDLSRATFNTATGAWDTPGKVVQRLDGIGLNGIDPISVESSNHLAIVSGGDEAFGVLQLPTTSGSGTPAISDYVGASMPNDPSGAAWLGWHQPNGLITYVSPNSGKPLGVMMNNGMKGGVAIGPTYLAIVDLEALLAAPRDSTGHKVAGSVDLVTSKTVRFVKVQ